MPNRLLAPLLVPALLLAPTLAMAGPCSDGIADLARKLSQSPALGPVTTGTLTGAAPGSTPDQKPSPGAPKPTGTSADNRLGGTAGTKEANAAVGNQVATSPQDVRRQQEGLPTAAAAAGAGSGQSVETTPGKVATGDKPDADMSKAKMSLEQARMLDQKNDPSCKDALDRTRQLMN